MRATLRHKSIRVRAEHPARPGARERPAPGVLREPPRLEEWAALPEDEPGELVDGELVEEEFGRNIHEVVVVWLAHLLRAWAFREATPEAIRALIAEETARRSGV